VNIKILASFLRTPRLASKLALMKDLRALSRLHFLYAAVDMGLLKVLRIPSSLQQIAPQVDSERLELLEPLLDLGVSVGELSRSNGVYTLEGKRARVLAEEDADPFAAYLQEAVSYHGSVYVELAARIKGAPLGEYLERTAGLVARSSRTLEPLMRVFVRDLVRERKPERLLEVGCGSGIYMRHAAEADLALTGVGIDMQEAAVRQARENLRRWGLSGRFTVLQADIRTGGAELGGPFELVTLYNNLYYFEPHLRPALFTGLRTLLAPGGTLAIVSLMRGDSVSSRNFDVVLRSTAGCAALPDSEETMRQLKSAGFADVRMHQIMKSEHFAGVLARK